MTHLSDNLLEKLADKTHLTIGLEQYILSLCVCSVNIMSSQSGIFWGIVRGILITFDTAFPNLICVLHRMIWIENKSNFIRNTEKTFHFTKIYTLKVGSLVPYWLWVCTKEIVVVSGWVKESNVGGRDIKWDLYKSGNDSTTTKL